MKRDRCDTCQLRLDCVAHYSELCLLDRKLVFELHRTLDIISSDRWGRYWHERSNVKIPFRAIIVKHCFEKFFDGARSFRRVLAKSFIRKHSHRMQGWRLNANRNSFIRGR